MKETGLCVPYTGKKKKTIYPFVHFLIVKIYKIVNISSLKINLFIDISTDDLLP